MARHAPSLARLASALLLLAAGCSHAPAAPPRPTLAQLETACAPAWMAAHADIDARGKACSADWECRAVRPEYLGCDAWANRDFDLGSRTVELESACAPISFVPDCVPQVGACKSARCTWRPPVPDPKACPAAAEELFALLRSPAPCGKDSDCRVVPLSGDWASVPVTWQKTYAKAWATAFESCFAGSFMLTPKTPQPRAVCSSGACSVLAPGEVAPRTGRGPVELEKGCVGREVRLPKSMAGYEGRHTLKFRVSRRGVPYGFEFLEPRPTTFVDTARRMVILREVGMAVSHCAFEPGQDGEDLVDYNVILPIRFAAP